MLGVALSLRGRNRNPARRVRAVREHAEHKRQDGTRLHAGFRRSDAGPAAREAGSYVRALT